MNITVKNYVAILDLVEKVPWNNQLQLYHGAPIGHNMRLAKGSPLAQTLATIEEKMAKHKPADSCRSRLTKDYAYFRICGNQDKTNTV